MLNVTISIPQELSKRMERHPDVNWSKVINEVLANYVDELEITEGAVVPIKELANKLKESGIDTSKINLNQAIKYYEESRKKDWKRLSST